MHQVFDVVFLSFALWSLFLRENTQYIKNIRKSEEKDNYNLSSAQKRIYYASTIDEKESIAYYGIAILNDEKGNYNAINKYAKTEKNER